ncbi:MAG: hypothetical protein H7834_02080 [Magnetococcus sp. YQC-9]
MKRINKFSCIVAGLLLSGCTTELPKSMVTSFDDVTSESDMKGANSKFTQTRSIALNGLMPTLFPGDLCYNKISRTADSMVCIAPKNARGSFYRVRTINGGSSEITESDVTNLRNAIAAATQEAEKLLQAKLNLVTYKVSTAQPDPGVLSSMSGTVIQANNDYHRAINNIYDKLNKPGLNVFYWDAQTDNSFRIGLGTLMGLSSEEMKHRSGFAVVGGLRVSHLFVGNDVWDDAWPALDKTKLEGSQYSSVPTTIYQAKYATYFSDMEGLSSLQARFAATIGQLAKIAANPSVELATMELDIGIVLSKMYAVGNAAMLGNSRVENKDLIWGSTLLEMNKPCGSDNPQCWQTFYTVGTQLKDLRNMVCAQCQEVDKSGKK